VDGDTPAQNTLSAESTHVQVFYPFHPLRAIALKILRSQNLQYAVAERMRALGWGQVEIIDSDLVFSAGMAAARREGFERVLSSVALGEVGIVGSRDVSRLSRTDKDWCRLLEVCQIFGTLIADEQQVYDLNYLDDQLVLGIKGTLSVVELKVIRQRMLAGQESKARRGELFKRLPVGYTVDALGKIALHPDRRVCEAIQLVFVKFRERWSVRQTFQWFRDHDVELPANPIQGTRLVWKIPSQSLVRDILCNPFYAGAYVWGRRPVTTLLVEGRLEKRQSAMRRAEECRVFIRDHHAGYIDWATYEENQRMVRRNSVNWQGDESMASIRAGQGLLVGLLRCGHCGRKLHVRYWGGRGTNARYLCKGDYDDGGQYCIGFGGSSVDRRVGQEVLKVISPLGAEASLRALEELSAGDAAQRAALSNKLAQLEYEAKKAFEQYDAVDARNRLAASELERRWNEKLEEVEAVKRRLSSIGSTRYSVSPEEETRIRSMGDNFAEVWQSDHCTPTLKKMVFRTVIEEIIVRADAERKALELVIHWKGGAHTQLVMERPRSATETRTPMEALEIIRRMAVRHGDDQIASVLNRLGYSTGKGKRWNQIRVHTARRNHSIDGQKRALPDPDRVSLNEAARICGVSHRTIERLVESGLLMREQVTPRAPWQIRRADLAAEPVRSILERLLRTGKLILPGECAEKQSALFAENEGDDNAGHHE
jgi:DNA invertase Pin-like site-specific DNA recombinase